MCSDRAGTGVWVPERGSKMPIIWLAFLLRAVPLVSGFFTVASMLLSTCARPRLTLRSVRGPSLSTALIESPLSAASCGAPPCSETLRPSGIDPPCWSCLLVFPSCDCMGSTVTWNFLLHECPSVASLLTPCIVPMEGREGEIGLSLSFDDSALLGHSNFFGDCGGALLVVSGGETG